jgi:hypothetical protein
MGDFLLVIAGPSNSDLDQLTQGWIQVVTVTPQKVWDAGIASKWQRRIGPLPKKSA